LLSFEALKENSHDCDDDYPKLAGWRMWRFERFIILLRFIKSTYLSNKKTFPTTWLPHFARLNFCLALNDGPAC